LGWVLLLPPETPNPLVRWSCDLLQLFLPPHDLTNIVVVRMDGQAVREYSQPGIWSRAIHARLLDRITEDQPRVVVFDVVMSDDSDPVADQAFESALRRSGRVVLAGDKNKITGQRGWTLIKPVDRFETNAALWGVSKVMEDPDRVVRRYLPGNPDEISLPWAVAKVAGAPITQRPDQRLAEERWLNYYRSAHPFEPFSLSYGNAEASEPGFFRDKAVFIGGKAETLPLGDKSDIFGTPFTKWNNQFIPGVEIIAIAYANLLKEDWLRRKPRVELLMVLLHGTVVGFGFQFIRLRTAVWVALALVALIIATSAALVLSIRLWTPWMVLVAAQLPCALFFRMATFRSGVPVAGPALGRPAGQPAAAAASSMVTVSDGRPEIADQTLLRCIGEGAYGQVWLARNAIGLHHAVKIVHRSRFGTDIPFERALRGIQKFMPISRSHEGFVHILHVGLNERAGFFFYIMEPGDDVTSGQQIDPQTYSPKTLASELRVRGTVPPRECLTFMVALTEAVERLHQHQLIHRDIKPANIIFVNGRPKLADIDLVTSLSAPGEVSHIGTEGYLAPEGPGTAAADVFSLGRVLYVALTGKPPALCPELPTQMTSHPDCGLLLELNVIICKACEFDVQRRYASAQLMHLDLLAAVRRWKV
jgi:CHASE2 domain-containing sensor protein